jgi:NTE family protein
VICLNPTSSLAEAVGGTPGERVGALVRAASGRRLGSEARKLREEGTEVIILQPDAEDIAKMGFNLMARGRRVEVLEQSRRSVALALRELRGTKAVLPSRSRPTGRGPARAARTSPARGASSRSGRRRAA